MNFWRYATIGFILSFISPAITSAQRLSIPIASFLGTHYYERVGYHVHTAGDVNGDGYDDFVIGTFHNMAMGYNSGAAYLILGKKEPDWDYNFSLNSSDARFIGEESYDAVGYCLAVVAM